MKTAAQYLDIVKRLFRQMVKSPDECLSRAEIIDEVESRGFGEDDYAIVREALLATEKVEAAAGRAGGLAIRRAQGNRREWGQAAEAKARRHIEENLPEDDPALDALKSIYEVWPQKRIADALA